MENLRLREAASTAVNVTVGKRSRDYLTDREVERLIEAARQNRSGHRDATAILVAYRHGLRASELVALRWDDIDLATGRLHVSRAKSGDASVHPISARESRALRKLLREAPTSPYVFISERCAPLSAAGYQRMVARAGVAAKFTFLVHSHIGAAGCGGCWAAPGGGSCAPGGGWSCAITGKVESTSAPLVTIAQDPRSILDKLFIAVPYRATHQIRTKSQYLAANVWPTNQARVTLS